MQRLRKCLTGHNQRLSKSLSVHAKSHREADSYHFSWKKMEWFLQLCVIRYMSGTIWLWRAVTHDIPMALNINLYIDKCIKPFLSQYVKDWLVIIFQIVVFYDLILFVLRTHTHVSIITCLELFLFLLGSHCIKSLPRILELQRQTFPTNFLLNLRDLFFLLFFNI